MTTLLPTPAVQVFNADYSDHGTISWQDAVSMILREVAHALEVHDPPRLLRSPSTTVELPKSVLLVRYAPVPYRSEADHASRAEILTRDGRRCQFAGCGSVATTIDHLLPRSRGGGNTWHNLVASCESCNGTKADRTPAEAGMRLVRELFRARACVTARRAPRAAGSATRGHTASGTVINLEDTWRTRTQNRWCWPTCDSSTEVLRRRWTTSSIPCWQSTRNCQQPTYAALWPHSTPPAICSRVGTKTHLSTGHPRRAGRETCDVPRSVRSVVGRSVLSAHAWVRFPH